MDRVVRLNLVAETDDIVEDFLSVGVVIGDDTAVDRNVCVVRYDVARFSLGYDFLAELPNGRL